MDPKDLTEKNPINIKRSGGIEGNWRKKSDDQRHSSGSHNSSKSRTDGNWRISTNEHSETDIGRGVRPSTRLKGSHTRQSLSEKELLPSSMMRKEFVQFHFPSNASAIVNMRKPTAGKWLVHGDHDGTWAKLLHLCNEGILIGIKASTAMITDTLQYMGGEKILCYTEDADDINDVKKAGDAIVEILELEDVILYYKTNKASEKGIYKMEEEGKRGVTKYMLTSKGTLYTRDKYRGWMLTKL